MADISRSLVGIKTAVFRDFHFNCSFEFMVSVLILDKNGMIML
jgi:hypothetical protein